MDITIPLAQVIPWAVSVMFGILQWSLNRTVQQNDRRLDNLDNTVHVTTTRMDYATMDIKLGLARIEERNSASQKELGSIDARLKHLDERVLGSNEFYRARIDALEKIILELKVLNSKDEHDG